jgi:hypothetical protein
MCTLSAPDCAGVLAGLAAVERRTRSTARVPPLSTGLRSVFDGAVPCDLPPGLLPLSAPRRKNGLQSKPVAGQGYLDQTRREPLLLLTLRRFCTMLRPAAIAEGDGATRIFHRAARAST